MEGHLRRMISSWRRPSLSRKQSWREMVESEEQFPRETSDGMREVSMLQYNGTDQILCFVQNKRFNI